MSIAELFIAHILWGIPGAKHVTPDGKKMYFLLGMELHCIEAPTGCSFAVLSDKDLTKLYDNYILAHIEDSL